MTTFPDQDIRRCADGSVDIRFYALRAGALRRAAIESHGRRQWRTLQAAVLAGRRLARAAMSRAAGTSGAVGV